MFGPLGMGSFHERECSCVVGTKLMRMELRTFVCLAASGAIGPVAGALKPGEGGVAPMVKIISPVTQRQVEAEQIDFESKAEPWSSYELSDGTTLKVRVILTGVLRIEGEYDQSGNPIYVVSSQNVVQANAPKKIRGTPTVGAMPPTRPSGGGPEVR